MKYFAYCRKSSEDEERQTLSIPAQIDEIKRAFTDAPDIEIIAWFEEKMSAKAPGRPVYAAMIALIEKGEADAIVAWHPDRLARNSVDGGWIIHLLDRKILKDLKFVSYTYEQSPQGMFMLQIMFGQSKYYVDALSVNVKRGMRKKIEMGWLPNLAPLGYRNDKEASTIIRDPERFSIIRRMWDLLLLGAYSVQQIHAIMNDEWGFRTPLRKKSGGRPISKSGMYRIFANPFYAGILDWYGEWRPGKHEPMITLEEFHRAQDILSRPGRPKPETHVFAYTGLLRCPCGLSITAEEKIKPSGKHYVYYHCTRRLLPRCTQPAVRVEVIESYVAALLRDIRLPTYIERLLSEKIDRDNADVRVRHEAQTEALGRALAKTQTELRTLTDLRVRSLIDDAEYIDRRRQFQKEELQLRDTIRRHKSSPSLWLELVQSVILFRKYGTNWYSAGNLDDKRLILQTVGWNSVLDAKALSIQARIPFKRIEKPADCLYWRAIVEALGTDPVKEAEVRMLIDSIKCLKARADARQSQTLAPPISPSIPTLRSAHKGRAAWRTPRAPHPSSERHPRAQNKAA